MDEREAINEAKQIGCFDVYDSFSFLLEQCRENCFNATVGTLNCAYENAQRLVQSSSGLSKQQDKETAYIPPSVGPCLLASPLSFYDRFHCICGIPAFLLRGPTNSNTAGQSDASSPSQAASEIVDCAFSMDASRVAVCYSCMSVVIWDADHGGVLFKHKASLKADTVCSISFQGNSSDVVLIASRNGCCMIWHLESNESEVIDYKEHWQGTRMQAADAIIPQVASFFSDGEKLVFSALIVYQSTTKTMKFIVAHMNAVNKNEAQILSFAVSTDIVVSHMEMSLDEEGLIVGFSDSRVEHGYCVLWPNFDQNAHHPVQLKKGTLGSWSKDSKLVVTWTVPDEPFPEENDASCAFLWDVEEIRRKSCGMEAEIEPKPNEFRNPFGKNVLWCKLAHDMDGHDRLIMCVIRTTTRLLYWNVKTKVITHNIATNISTRDMILGDRKSWIKLWVKRSLIKGLSPIVTSKDLQQIGIVTGVRNQALILDQVFGTQVLDMQIPNNLSNGFARGVDIILSPTRRKFALIGSTDVMVFVPAHPSMNNNPNVSEAQMILYEHKHDKLKEDENFIMKFSGDGNSLGILCVNSREVHVMHLTEGKTSNVSTTQKYGGAIRDFSLSFNGNNLVVCTERPSLVVWSCDEETPTYIGEVMLTHMSKAIGITSDSLEIVTLLENGDIVWYGAVTERASPLISTFETSVKHRSKSNLTQETAGFLNSNIKEPLIDLSSEGISQFGSFQYDTRNVSSRLSGRYSEVERRSLANIATCRISDNCKKAMIVHDVGNKIEIWDLACRRMEVLKEIDDDVWDLLSSDASISYSVATLLIQKPYIVKNANESLSLDSNPQAKVCYLAHEDYVILALIPSFALPIEAMDVVDASVFQERDYESISNLSVLSSKDFKPCGKLNGPSLVPHKGVTISSDGRHIACLSGKFASKVVVWSVYATDELLRDYGSLSISCKIDSKQFIYKNIPIMIETFGINFISFVHPCGNSFLHQAIAATNYSLIKFLLKCAFQEKMILSFWTLKKATNGELKYFSVVDLSLQQRHPELIKMLMKYLIKRVVHEEEVGRILWKNLAQIHNLYPHVALRVLHNPELFCAICDVEALEDDVHKSRFTVKTCTSFNTSYEETRELWNPIANNDGKEQLTITSIAKVFPYYGACDIGSDGLLRSMLIDGAHHKSYAAFPIKAIVNYKWSEYAREAVLHELAHHCVLLVSFTTYTFFLCNQDTYLIPQEEGNEKNLLESKVALLISVVLATPCLLREMNQCVLYLSKHRIRGCFYWLGSTWNWMEVFSYVNIVIIIPLGQFWILNNEKRTIVLSLFVAIESLLLWSRVLFYLRPFRKTGSLVIIISSIIVDIIPFLFLAFCVMFGFAVAFHVLYRHINKFPGIGDKYESVTFLFGTFGDTFFTLFAYMFGNFELKDIYAAPQEATAIILFLLYMVIIAIILLNMLIAIMGDSFNRIRSDESTRFTKARALIIDDIDSMLSERKKQKIEKNIKNYLCVAIPTYLHDKVIAGDSKRAVSGGKQYEADVKILRREWSSLRRKATQAVAPDSELVPWAGNKPVQGPSLPITSVDGPFAVAARFEEETESDAYPSSVSSHRFDDDVSN